MFVFNERSLYVTRKRILFFEDSFATLVSKKTEKKLSLNVRLVFFLLRLNNTQIQFHKPRKRHTVTKLLFNSYRVSNQSHKYINHTHRQKDSDHFFIMKLIIKLLQTGLEASSEQDSKKSKLNVEK